jgi:hypothetical protein
VSFKPQAVVAAYYKIFEVVSAAHPLPQPWQKGVAAPLPTQSAALCRFVFPQVRRSGPAEVQIILWRRLLWQILYSGSLFVLSTFYSLQEFHFSVSFASCTHLCPLSVHSFFHLYRSIPSITLLSIFLLSVVFARAVDLDHRGGRRSRDGRGRRRRVLPGVATVWYAHLSDVTVNAVRPWQ